MMYKIEELLFHTKQAVEEVASYIKEQIGKVSKDDVEEKELNSLVSYVDKNAEEMLVEKLSKILPDAGFVTEEETVTIIDREWTWIIDPLDGTTNFLYSIPHFCISVALQQKDEVKIGVVHGLPNDEQFYAAKGKGAFMNEHPIKVSSMNDISQVLVATGFPYRNDYNVDRSFAILKNFLTKTRGIRRLGSAALDLAYVAIGRLGAYYESYLNKWDLAAGALIVEEAGGIVSDFEKGDQFLEKGEIIASAPQFYEEISSILINENED